MFPITPDCEPDALPPQPLRPPSLSDHPLSLPRLGAAVDSLIRPPAKGKPPRPHDPPALLILFAMFLVLFILLIFVLRSVFPSTVENARVYNMRHVHDNLDRVARNITPVQFWPLPDSLERAQQPMPSPFMTNVSIPRIWDTRFLATRHLIAKRQRLRLSIVAACKDRSAFLQTALPAWLSQLHPRLDEVVLVDWATSTPDFVPLSEVVRASRDSRVSVITLAHASTWVLSRAYNLGFALARGEWILKLDCDTSVQPDFLKVHPLPSAKERFFYRFDWARARDRNEEHLNGIFLVRTAHLRGVYGYDERITTYGWEDSDLYKRLEAGTEGLEPSLSGDSDVFAAGLGNAAMRAVDINTSSAESGDEFNIHPDPRFVEEEEVGPVPPLKAVPIVQDTVRHMPHDDSLRGAAQHLSMGPVLETQVNSQASEGLPTWSVVGLRERTRYQMDILSRDARFLSASVLRTPSALLELVTSTRRDAIVAEAVSRVLHDGYGLPWASLSQLDDSREHVVRVLARSARGRGADSVVFSVVDGSIPDRIIALASSIIFAASHGRPLFVTWGADDKVASEDDKHVQLHSQYDGMMSKVGDFFDLDDVNSQHHRLSAKEMDVAGGNGDTAVGVASGNSNLSAGGGPGSSSSSTSSFSNSAAVAAAHSSNRPIFFLHRWACTAAATACADSDPAFKSLEEWRYGRIHGLDANTDTTEQQGTTDDMQQQQQQRRRLDDIIQGNVSGKRNVLLRLRGGLPDQSDNQLEFAIASFRGSERVQAYVDAVSTAADLGAHVGVYVGAAVHGKKQVDAMAARIAKMHTVATSSTDKDVNGAMTVHFFVTGPAKSRDLVQYARSLMPAAREVRDALDKLQLAEQQSQQQLEERQTPLAQQRQQRQHADTVKEIAELMILARCKEVINDGRPTQNTVSVIKAFQQQFRHEQQLVRQRQVA